jgi:hypothetical protein
LRDGCSARITCVQSQLALAMIADPASCSGRHGDCDGRQYHDKEHGSSGPRPPGPTMLSRLWEEHFLSLTLDFARRLVGSDGHGNSL